MSSKGEEMLRIPVLEKVVPTVAIRKTGILRLSPPFDNISISHSRAFPGSTKDPNLGKNSNLKSIIGSKF
jgi:hypothetical protein